MTFKTFDELDVEAGPGALFTNYAPKAAPTPVGYDTPESLAKAQEIANRSTFGAAFRQDNTVGSMLSRKDLGVDNDDDGTFNPVEYIKANGLEGHERSFYGVLNSRLADAKRDQILMERRDKETLDASGWLGTFAQIAAGVADLPTLIPGTVAVKGAAGVYSVARSALMAGVAAGATQAVTEGALHATQETRTASESAVNVGGALIFGSLLGGGVAAVLSKNDRITATRALEQIEAINSGRTPNTFAPDGAPGSVGAAANPFVDPVDAINAPRTREELAVEGGAASAAVGATAWINPVLRGTQRYGAAARQIANNIYENTIYRTMHGAGETTGQSVEALARTQVSALMAQAGEEAESAYAAMWKGAGVGERLAGSADPMRLSKKAFYEEVGRAMRNNDTSDNPFVAQAAGAYRKMFDHFTDQAIKLGILDAEDLDVKTAASYFSRVYNKDRLVADEATFLDVIAKHYADGMAKSYDEDAARVAFVRAKRAQQVEDISLSGPARAQRVEEILQASERLDRQFPQFVDRASDLAEARAAVRGTSGEARAAAQAEVKRILAEGGQEFQDYLTTRAELRSRSRNLRERNPDAQAARAERLAERIDETEARVERSMDIYGRQARNLLNKLESDPVGRADELVAVTERQVAKMRAAVEQAEKRANEAKAQYVEAMDPAAGFDAAARRAVREGASGDDAVRAGTREADRITKQIEDAERAIKDITARADKLEKLTERLARRETAREAAAELAAELEAGVKAAAQKQAARSLRRGEQLAAMKERAAKLTPEEIAARLEQNKSKFDDALEKVEAAFDTRWGVAKAKGLERGEKYDFEAAARDVARQVFDTLTGRAAQNSQVPGFIVPITRGPLKDRTFMVPDELLAGRGWLNDDVREVGERYARQMAGEIELTRRFGKADMSEQIKQIQDEYSEMQVAVANATTPQQINEILGRNKFGPRKNLEKAKLEAAKLLAADLESAVADTNAGRDLIRGMYGNGVNNTNFASVSRMALHFNYLAKMGGVLLSNVTEFYRPAMVHGLMPYMRNLPDHLAQLFGAGSKGLQLSLAEAKLAGTVVERVNHAMAASLGDVMDPFVSKTTSLERLMQKGTRVASRWNLINHFTDAQQAISSTLSQHRILESVMGNGGRDGSFVDKGTRLIRMLGIDERTQRDIAEYVAVHGQNVDGIQVANTERWLAAARETGNPAEIARAENAVRTYRTAVNTDVNSIVSRRGLGDAPLFGNHPVGRLLLQFSGYTLGAHSRVMVRGLQEDKTRLVGGLIAMSSMGALTSYISAWRAGQERWEKYTKEIRDNPAKLIGEGLDRSGFFPLLFDVSNRIEKVTGAVGQDQKINPIKSTIATLGGGSPLGVTSTRGSDSSGAIGAIFGPTVGILDGAVAAGRVAADTAAGRTPPKRDLSLATGMLPYNSYVGARELLQVLNGNSPWARR